MSYLNKLHETIMNGSSSSSSSIGSSSSNTTTTTTIFVDGMAISITLFGMSAIYFIKYIVQQQRLSSYDSIPFYQRRRKSLQNLHLYHGSSNSNSSNSTRNILFKDRSLQQQQQQNLDSVNGSHNNNGTTSISNRGRTALIPMIPYQKQFFACLNDPFDINHNRTGYIALCVAENKLITSTLVDRCAIQSGTAFAALSDPAVYCYNSFLGMPVAREAAAYFIQRWFLQYNAPPNQSSQYMDPTSNHVVENNMALSDQQQQQYINPSHIALAAGAAAILNNLFFVLGDVGDACLIPAPYYAAFENDMNLISNIVPFAIHQANPMHGPTESELSLAYLQCKATGLNPRFLLLTNPNNPLAVIYRPNVMKDCVSWARKRHMHTIVDEIYALSTHQETGHAFQSIIRILDNQLDNDVHMVWAASKDFGCSGVRYGVLYSQNELLMTALQSASFTSCVSGPIQYLISELLTDDVFVRNYLNESRDRLLHSYTICTRKLDEMVLPFIPAEAGMFIYVDFSSLLPSKTFEWEQKLSELMFQVRVVLTPGESQHDSAPGMFRICYAWITPEALDVAMERLSRLVAKVRRMEWDDINGRVVDSIING